MLKMMNIISERRKKIKPYTRKASQNPPAMFRISEKTVECRDSSIFAIMNVAARATKIIVYNNLFHVV